MAKRIDITEKLTFEGNPFLVIKGEELEVNTDAPTALKIMNLTNDGGAEYVRDAYELVFTEEARNKIDQMKLSTKDWMTVIQEAMTLIMGEDNGRGEQ